MGKEFLQRDNPKYGTFSRQFIEGYTSVVVLEMILNKLDAHGRDPKNMIIVSY